MRSRSRSLIPALLLLSFPFPLPSLGADPASTPTAHATAPMAPPTITLIIDDLGMTRTSGERALRLPGQVTLAILPYERYSAPLARRAATLGKEVILHMPMENLHNKPIGEGGLDHLQDQLHFSAAVDAALDELPDAVGISNHMGSFLTQQPEQMGWLMASLKRRNLFFVDSRTTPDTIAASAARAQDVSEVSRDVFLDNVLTFYHVDEQFQRLLKLARQRGHAVAIGHPHEVTLTYLEMALPLLDDQHIELVSASSVVAPAWSHVPRTMIASDTTSGDLAGGSQ